MKANDSDVHRPAILKYVYSRGSDGFNASEAWCEHLIRGGTRCSVCHALRDKGIDQLDAVVVEHRPAGVVIGTVSGLHSGLVVRQDLIDLIGVQRLGDLFHFKPVVLEMGRTLADFQYLVEKTPRGCFRGQQDSRIELCEECGRLLYWPMPLDKWYILRNYWDGNEGVTILDHHLLCTPEYYRDVLDPRRFSRLRSEDHVFADLPSDGFPVGYADLVAEVRRRGWITT